MYPKALLSKFLQVIRVKKAISGCFLKKKNLPAKSFSRMPFFIKTGLVFLALIFASTIIYAQKSRKDLEDRRKTLIKEIESTNKLLDDTRRSQQATLNRYYTLQNQIQKRVQLIATLQEEIKLADESIERSTEVIAALSSDIEHLKSEYALMARKAYRMKLGNDAMSFLLSSKSLNEAFKRWRYLKQYDAYRQKQAHLIVETQKTLSKKSQNIESHKHEKEQLLVSHVSQKNILSQEMNDSNHLLEKLKEDENKLKNELDIKKRAHEDLNKAIEKIIIAEIERKKEQARTAPPPSRTSSAATTATKTVPLDSPETILLSSNFIKNKDKLPWPVQNGAVVSFFGKQIHPDLKKIEILNNGIDIKTENQAVVRAVFEGEVLGMQFIPGNNYMVIIRHGNYYTVYSNLEEVSVKRGEKVVTKQEIGKAGMDKISNHYELHFEVWREKERQDPVKWLSR